MKFLSYRHQGVLGYGIIKGDAVVDLASRFPVCPDLKSFIAHGGPRQVASLVAADKGDFALESVEFEPVINNPDKIICVGLNYEDHRLETGRPKVDFPTMFTRYADTQIGHEQPVLKPWLSDAVDYEGELAVVIGKGGRYIAEADALSHVAGYACYNDVSVRDFQNHTAQFTPGKNFPGTGAFGPYLVTPDEVGELGSQRIQTRLNGQVVQDATLSDMIFSVEQLIAYASKWTSLAPGDVIVSGTPGGVGMKRTPPLYMKAGDEVIVEIDGVGLLRNVLVEEPIGGNAAKARQPEVA